MKQDEYCQGEVGKQVYEKTWAGKYWGRGGAIALSRQRFAELKRAGKEREGLSALASTYYSAAGTARAKFGQAKGFSKILWLWRAIYCLFQARQLAVRLENLVGVDNLTVPQIDVLSRIHLACRATNHALVLASVGLNRVDKNKDNEAFLRRTAAEAYEKRGEMIFAKAEWFSVKKLAESGDLRPTTLVRIARALGEFFKHLGNNQESERWFKKAKDLAQSADLADQETKIAATQRQ